jgi:hypothetical protein
LVFNSKMDLLNSSKFPRVISFISSICFINVYNIGSTFVLRKNLVWENILVYCQKWNLVQNLCLELLKISIGFIFSLFYLENQINIFSFLSQHEDQNNKWYFLICEQCQMNFLLFWEVLYNILDYSKLSEYIYK